MKILVVIHDLSGGGAERVASVLVKEWSRKHEVVFVLANTDYIAYQTTNRVIDIQCTKSWNFICKVPKLYKIFKREKPDKIVSFMEGSNIPTILTGLFTGDLNRTLVSMHTNPKRLNVLYKVLVRALYRLPLKVVAVSSGVASYLENMVPGIKSLVTIPNPINIEDVWDLSKESSSAAVHGDYIIAIGRLEYVKGFDLLLAAFSKLNNKSVNLIILGEGLERELLAEKIKDLNMEDRVYMPGYLANPFALLKKAQMLVVPSRHEGFGNVIIEAMICNCPVVAFDCNYGPNEIIEHGVDGWLVKSGDTEALASRIEKTLQLPLDERDNVINKAATKTKKWDVSKIANKWL